MTATEPHVDPAISRNLSNNHVYRAKTKSMTTAYLLWLLLGIVGAHRFYLRRNEWGWIMIAFVIAPVILYLGLMLLDVLVPPLGNELLPYVKVLSVLIWLFPLVRWLADVIRIPTLVREYNDQVWQEVMQ